MKEKAEDDGCPSGLRATRSSTIIGLFSQRESRIEHNGQTEGGREMLKGQRQPNALAINSREDPSANWQKREEGGGGETEGATKGTVRYAFTVSFQVKYRGYRRERSKVWTLHGQRCGPVKHSSGGCPARSRGPAFDVIIPDRDAAASERVWSLTFERMQNGH